MYFLFECSYLLLMILLTQLYAFGFKLIFNKIKFQ